MVSKRKLLGSVAGLMVLGLANSLVHATLLGISTDTDSLYEIDPVTGASTLITGSNGNFSFSGLSSLSGSIYASDANSYPGGSTGIEFDAVSIDPFTGALTFVSNQDDSSNWHGLASDEDAGLLYSIDMDDSNTLKSLTPDGTATSIGFTGIDGRGMAYDDNMDILYATGPGTGTQSLYTVDTTTGTATLIGSTGIDSFFVGLAFDELLGALFMVADPDNNSGASANLYTLDLNTGAATLLGSTDVNAIDGLAWVSTEATVPEPALFGLVGIGFLGIGYARKRLKAYVE